MKRRLRSSAIIAAISVPALGLGLGLSLGLGGAASAAPQAASTAVSHFSERTVVVNCQGRPQVRPADFTLACGDGNDYLTGLSWTSWAGQRHRRPGGERLHPLLRGRSLPRLPGGCRLLGQRGAQE